MIPARLHSVVFIRVAATILLHPLDTAVPARKPPTSKPVRFDVARDIRTRCGALEPRTPGTTSVSPLNPSQLITPGAHSSMPPAPIPPPVFIVQRRAHLGRSPLSRSNRPGTP